MGLANEIRRYIVTSPLIGWAQTQNHHYNNLSPSHFNADIGWAKNCNLQSNVIPNSYFFKALRISFKITALPVKYQNVKSKLRDMLLFKGYYRKLSS